MIIKNNNNVLSHSRRFSFLSSYSVSKRQDKSLVLTPTAQPPLSTLIWLHGLTETADFNLRVLSKFSPAPVPPSCKLVLLQAPTRPVSVLNGQSRPSWYDIRDTNSPYSSLPELLVRYD